MQPKHSADIQCIRFKVGCSCQTFPRDRQQSNKKLICKKKCGIVVENLPIPVTSVKMEMVSIWLDFIFGKNSNKHRAACLIKSNHMGMIESPL